MTARITRITFVGALCLVLCACLMWAYVPAQTASAQDAKYKGEVSFDDSVFTNLDYGVYWFDSSSPIPQKSGTEGANFDPSKPTIIYTHGMKISEGYLYRELLSLWSGTNSQFASKKYEPYEYSKDFYLSLLNMGYNVGIFYWNQLAEIPFDKDYRIWTSDLPVEETGTGNLSYYVSGADGRTRGNPDLDPTDSVAVLMTEAVIGALGNNYSQPWRLAGHSMGGQLVLATTQSLIYRQKKGLIGRNLVPERVSLIDPYLCNSAMSADMHVDHLDGKAVEAGTWTADLCTDAMEDIADYGIALDAYGGTEAVYRNYYMMGMIDDITNYGMDTDGPNMKHAAALLARMSKAACWTHLEALADKYAAMSHCMIIDYYFGTMYEPEQTDAYGVTLPSVNSSTDYIRSLRGFNFLQMERKGSGANPFYRHTTDFVRTDGNMSALRTYYDETDAGVISGIATNYDKVEVFNAKGRTVQSAEISANGEYHLFGLAPGVYTLSFTGFGQSETIAATVNTQQNALSAVEPIYNWMPDLVTVGYIAIAPVVLVIVMIVMIAVAASAAKKAKKAESEGLTE